MGCPDTGRGQGGHLREATRAGQQQRAPAVIVESATKITIVKHKVSAGWVMQVAEQWQESGKPTSADTGIRMFQELEAGDPKMELLQQTRCHPVRHRSIHLNHDSFLVSVP